MTMTMTMTMAMAMTMTMGTPSPHRSNSPKAKPCKMHHCMAFNAENSKTQIVNASCFSHQIVLYSTYSPYAFYIISAYFPGSTITISIEPFPICSHSYFIDDLGSMFFQAVQVDMGPVLLAPSFQRSASPYKAPRPPNFPPWLSSFVGHFKGLYIWQLIDFQYTHTITYTHIYTHI